MSIVAYVVGLAIGYALTSWWFMLLLGAVHNDVFTWVPALGLWQTFLVVLLIAMIGGLLTLSNTLSNKD